MIPLRTGRLLPSLSLTLPVILRSRHPTCSYSSKNTSMNKFPLKTMTSSSNDSHRIRYDLSRGHPNDALLPIAEMQAIASSFLNDVTPKTLAIDGIPPVHVSSKENSSIRSWVRSLNYGPNAGDDRFLAGLQTFLNRHAEADLLDDPPSPTDVVDSETFASKMPIENAINDQNLFITGGVSHGLELLCATLTHPGDEVWVERPTYFLAPKIFESHGLVVKPLPMLSDHCTQNKSKLDPRATAICDVDSDGIGRVDIDRLIDMVENRRVPSPKIIYIIPSYQNPTGRMMTVQERWMLASFALRNNVIVVADEVYHLLDWELNGAGAHSSRRPARMFRFHNSVVSRNKVDMTLFSKGVMDDDLHSSQGCCISVSSFTKIFAPGIRLGWIEAPHHIIQKLNHRGYINSQGGVAPFTGRMMTHAIEFGLLDKYLDRIKLEYRERHQIICNILEEEPRIALLSRNYSSKFNRAGGYFVWIQFPSDVDSLELLKFSQEEYGVKFMPGIRCDPFASKADGFNKFSTTQSGLVLKSCARLCFADLDKDDLVKGTRKFLQAFRSFAK
mmetsp:Transcript_6874/g.14088  ORF Transcript_6874/g.14088 Transcript_6874/m.14088 type:complete len:558 (-) Transcript_6874:26-1699(-)